MESQHHRDTRMKKNERSVVMSTQKDRSMKSLAGIAGFLVCALSWFGFSEAIWAEVGIRSDADPSPRVITSENLFQNERYWPYHVILEEAWKPRGFQGESFAWEQGTVGVLVRVEPGGLLRVDFGRFGVHEVPISATTVLERANQIQRGERSKAAPNFVVAVIRRCLSLEGSPPQYWTAASVAEVDRFVLVAGEPGSESLRRRLKKLTPLAEDKGTAFVLLPHGSHRMDPAVIEKARSDGWPGCVVHSRFSDAYRHSIFGEDAERTAAIIQTPEGRILERVDGAPARSKAPSDR